MIDTHAHIYLDQFKDDLGEVVKRAREAGVDQIFMPNIDSQSIPLMLQIESQFPGICRSMMGLHPCSVDAGFEAELSIVRHWLQKRPFAAIGEIGIDMYWDKSTLDIQKEAFRRQVEWSREMNLPIVIHSRESTAIILDLLEDFPPGSVRGVFHCFTGDQQEAARALDLGFYLGIGGVLTFKNAGLDKTVASLPMEYLVLETDAPYLAPVPFRGKRNESSYLTHIVAKLAGVKGLPVQEVMEQTTKNAERLFAPEAG